MDENPGLTHADQLDAPVELIGAVPVRGGSMLPTLREGQVLSVDFSPVSPRRGDLLFFRQEGDLVVHRVVARSRFRDGGPCFRTRGDGRPNLDPRVSPSKGVGRVVAVQDARGWLDLLTRSARTYATAVAWHDRYWAGAGVLAAGVDRVLRKLGLPSPVRQQVARLDGALLRGVHRLLFARCHRRLASSDRIPATTDPGVAVERPPGS